MNEVVIKVKRNDIVSEIVAPEYVKQVYEIITNQSITDTQKLKSIFEVLNGIEIHVSYSFLKRIRNIDIYQYLESVRQDLIELKQPFDMQNLKEITAKHFGISIRAVERIVKQGIKKN